MRPKLYHKKQAWSQRLGRLLATLRLSSQPISLISIVDQVRLSKNQNMTDNLHPGSASTPAIEADVLVIGGGLAGAWAAVAAAREGALVVLADKGYCGASGVTATAGPGHWWVPPDPDLRAEAIRRREFFANGRECAGISSYARSRRGPKAAGAS
jgi:FAD dependent oxidoreductase